MREKWKRLWARRPRLSRGQRTVGNFLLCVPILIWFWGMAGYPLPTAELEFRRAERTRLLPRSEILYNSQKDGPIHWRDLPELDFHSFDVVVGAGEGYACVYDAEYQIMRTCPLEEGPAPVPIYHTSALYMPSPGVLRGSTPLLFLQVPREAERAEVEIHAEDRDGEELHYQGEGWRLAPGRWIFAAAPGSSFSGDWYEGGQYTLTLYREDGSLLLEWEGTLR